MFGITKNTHYFEEKDNKDVNTEKEDKIEEACTSRTHNVSEDINITRELAHQDSTNTKEDSVNLDSHQNDEDTNVNKRVSQENNENKDNNDNHERTNDDKHKNSANQETSEYPHNNDNNKCTGNDDTNENKDTHTHSPKRAHNNDDKALSAKRMRKEHTAQSNLPHQNAITKRRKDRPVKYRNKNKYTQKHLDITHTHTNTVDNCDSQSDLALSDNKDTQTQCVQTDLNTAQHQSVQCNLYNERKDSHEDKSEYTIQAIQLKIALRNISYLIDSYMGILRTVPAAAMCQISELARNMYQSAYLIDETQLVDDDIAAATHTSRTSDNECLRVDRSMSAPQEKAQIIKPIPRRPVADIDYTMSYVPMHTHTVSTYSMCCDAPISSAKVYSNTVSDVLNLASSISSASATTLMNNTVAYMSPSTVCTPSLSERHNCQSFVHHENSLFTHTTKLSDTDISRSTQPISVSAVLSSTNTLNVTTTQQIGFTYVRNPNATHTITSDLNEQTIYTSTQIRNVYTVALSSTVHNTHINTQANTMRPQISQHQEPASSNISFLHQSETIEIPDESMSPSVTPPQTQMCILASMLSESQNTLQQHNIDTSEVSVSQTNNMSPQPMRIVVSMPSASQNTLQQYDIDTSELMEVISQTNSASPQRQTHTLMSIPSVSQSTLQQHNTDTAALKAAMSQTHSTSPQRQMRIVVSMPSVSQSAPQQYSISASELKAAMLQTHSASPQRQMRIVVSIPSVSQSTLQQHNTDTAALKAAMSQTHSTSPQRQMRIVVSMPSVSQSAPQQYSISASELRAAISQATNMPSQRQTHTFTPMPSVSSDISFLHQREAIEIPDDESVSQNTMSPQRPTHTLLSMSSAPRNVLVPQCASDVNPMTTAISVARPRQIHLLMPISSHSGSTPHSTENKDAAEFRHFILKTEQSVCSKQHATRKTYDDFVSAKITLCHDKLSDELYIDVLSTQDRQDHVSNMSAKLLMHASVLSNCNLSRIMSQTNAQERVTRDKFVDIIINSKPSSEFSECVKYIDAQIHKLRAEIMLDIEHLADDSIARVIQQYYNQTGKLDVVYEDIRRTRERTFKRGKKQMNIELIKQKLSELSHPECAAELKEYRHNKYGPNRPDRCKTKYFVLQKQLSKKTQDSTLKNMTHISNSTLATANMIQFTEEQAIQELVAYGQFVSEIQFESIMQHIYTASFAFSKNVYLIAKNSRVPSLTLKDKLVVLAGFDVNRLSCIMPERNMILLKRKYLHAIKERLIKRMGNASEITYILNVLTECSNLLQTIGAEPVGTPNRATLLKRYKEVYTNARVACAKYFYIEDVAYGRPYTYELLDKQIVSLEIMEEFLRLSYLRFKRMSKLMMLNISDAITAMLCFVQDYVPQVKITDFSLGAVLCKIFDEFSASAFPTYLLAQKGSIVGLCHRKVMMTDSNRAKMEKAIKTFNENNILFEDDVADFSPYCYMCTNREAEAPADRKYHTEYLCLFLRLSKVMCDVFSKLGNAKLLYKDLQLQSYNSFTHEVLYVLAISNTQHKHVSMNANSLESLIALYCHAVNYYVTHIQVPSPVICDRVETEEHYATGAAYMRPVCESHDSDDDDHAQQDAAECDVMTKKQKAALNARLESNQK